MVPNTSMYQWSTPIYNNHLGWLWSAWTKNARFFDTFAEAQKACVTEYDSAAYVAEFVA